MWWGGSQSRNSAYVRILETVFHPQNVQFHNSMEIELQSSGEFGLA